MSSNKQYLVDLNIKFRKHIGKYCKDYSILVRKAEVPLIKIRTLPNDLHFWERAVKRKIPRNQILTLCHLLLDSHYCEILYLLETNSYKYVMKEVLKIRVDYKDFLIYLIVNKGISGEGTYTLTLLTCMPCSYRKEEIEEDNSVDYYFKLGDQYSEE